MFCSGFRRQTDLDDTHRRLCFMAKQIAQAPAEKIKTANPKRLGKRKDIHWQLWLMMIPAIVYMLLFVYKPMGGVLIAFQDYSTFSERHPSRAA